MEASPLDSPPQDIRTEWRRLDAAIRDIAKVHNITSSHPHLISVYFDGGGIIVNCTGLINALAAKGVQLF